MVTQVVLRVFCFCLVLSSEKQYSLVIYKLMFCLIKLIVFNMTLYTQETLRLEKTQRELSCMIL